MEGNITKEDLFEPEGIDRGNKVLVDDVPKRATCEELPDIIECCCEPCSRAYFGRREPNDICRIEDRAMDHIEEVADLLSLGAIITIIAKPDNTALQCHRVLLEYYSSLLIGQSFMQLSFLTIPEDVKVVSAFVRWLYSGRLERPDRDGQMKFACSLWHFGTRIDAPVFVNDVIHLICDYHMQYALEANFAKLVYETAPKHSTLRALIAHMIRAQGPLSAGLAKAKSWVFDQAWHDLIHDGGEIVEDAVNGFRAENPEEGPWHNDKRHSHLENEPDRNPEYWIEERLLRYVEHSYILRLERGDNGAASPDEMVLA